MENEIFLNKHLSVEIETLQRIFSFANIKKSKGSIVEGVLHKIDSKDLQKIVNTEGENYLLVKYEDLIEKPESEFKKIASYLEPLLKVRFTNENVAKAIELSSFDRLKKIEEKEGFFESVTNLETGKKETFFNLGPKNDWRNILDESISDEINKRFESEMKELGYI